MDPKEIDDLAPAALGLAAALGPKLRQVIQDSLSKEMSDDAQVIAAILATEKLHARTVALAVHMGLLDSDVRDSYWKDNKWWSKRFGESLAEFDKKGLFPPPGETD